MDRISILPDDVLIHVLSFLSTREAAQTCILAKRWREISAFVPVLRLNLDEFLTDGENLENNERLKDCEYKFQQFMNGVMANRKCPNLDKFECIWCIYENYSDASMEWLDRVALLNPRAISVLIFRKTVLDVPQLVFSCASLQELELSLYTDDLRTVMKPNLINLPALNYLELASVTLEDDFTQKLFSGCPALESLSLAHCDLGFSDISSEVLKTLVIEECDQISQIQICCPCLIILDIEANWQTKGISINNTTSLAQADIRLNTSQLLFDGDLNIVGGLSNVSILKFDLRSADLKVYCLLPVYKIKSSICTQNILLLNQVSAQNKESLTFDKIKKVIVKVVLLHIIFNS